MRSGPPVAGHQPRCLPQTVRLWTRLWALVGLVGWAAQADPNDSRTPEYRVKAAYLLNFCKFVEWPAKKLGAPEAPLVIGVLGSDPFGNDLDAALAGKTVAGRQLQPRRLNQISEALACHIVFLPRSNAEALSDLLSQLKDEPVLTVGETEHFARDGGMINFLIVNDTVKLEINQGAAVEHQLKISSKLLALARPAKTAVP